jgi:tetratricopeptide (TPR) repeat protein
MSSELLETEKVWLIKSSGLILGPFSIRDVTQGLRERKFSILDEIRSPERRWTFVREHALLKDVVSRLRREDLERLEKTGVANDITKSMTDSETMTLTMDQDVPKENGDRRAKPPMFGSLQDHSAILQTKSRIHKFKKAIWASAISVVLILGIFGYWEFQKKAKLFARSDYVKLAISRQKIGKDDQAAQFFLKANELKPLTFDEREIAFASLVRAKKYSATIRQFLDDSTSKGYTHKAEKHLRGLSWMQEGQFQMADQEFQSILGSEPNHDEVRTNLSINYYLRGNFRQSLEEAEKIKGMALFGVNHRILLTALNLLKDHQLITKVSMSRAIGDVLSLKKDFGVFQVETRLILAQLYTRSQQIEKSIEIWMELFNLDPLLSNDYVRSWEVNEDYLNSERLKTFCEFSTGGSSSSVEVSASVWCSMFSGDVLGGLKKIEEARKQFPSDENLILLNALALSKVERHQEAKTLLDLIRSQSILHQQLTMNYCIESKDLNCLERIISTRGSSEMEWIAFLKSKLFWLKNNKIKAKSILESGLFKYRPLLELKAEVLDE